MPFVEVKWFEGRSDEQKREVVKALTDVMVDRCGCDAEQVWVTFNDFSRSDWAIAGKMCGKE